MRCASCERRNPAARFRARLVSSFFSRFRRVKNTFACDRSGETSTDVSVTMPTCGSRTSRRSRSASSRWIRSATFCGRPRLTASVAFHSQRARHLEDFEHLELVAFLEFLEGLEGHAALEAGLDLAHVVLEALEGIDLAGVNDHAVAQYPQLCAALDHAFLHIAAGDGPDLRDAEHLPHFDQADDAL